MVCFYMTRGTEVLHSHDKKLTLIMNFVSNTFVLTMALKIRQNQLNLKLLPNRSSLL